MAVGVDMADQELQWMARTEPESKYPLEEPEKRCKKALCECDSKAAKCFSEATFNTSYTDYDTSKC